MMVSLHWALRKLSATIINDVLPEVLLFTLNATSKPKTLYIGEKLTVSPFLCRSGGHRFSKNGCKLGRFESAIDRSWFGSWFGYIV
jgi:hypothetical protein